MTEPRRSAAERGQPAPAAAGHRRRSAGWRGRRGWAVSRWAGQPRRTATSARPLAPVRTPVPAAGVHQAGVDPPGGAAVAPPGRRRRPGSDPRHARRVAAPPSATRSHGSPTPSSRICELTPDGPGDLTVTVGLGADGARRHRPPGPGRSGTTAQLSRVTPPCPPDRRGGDLLISVNASRPDAAGAGAGPPAGDGRRVPAAVVRLRLPRAGRPRGHPQPVRLLRRHHRPAHPRRT